ncbi:hypothetical protein C0Z18_00935 [Trinickia dabaoshanensis]|uniref:Uncharacterized protein n=1 Tax=Trinickia dabaoshanensis TaxID=564714 RepID=A0A2N7W353_9BURK|nr:hypothetical protein C0Z18_00935 [Trinickia dabaoshanensis]
MCVSLSCPDDGDDLPARLRAGQRAATLSNGLRTTLADGSFDMHNALAGHGRDELRRRVVPVPNDRRRS